MTVQSQSDLLRVADVAWRAREALHLALPALTRAGLLDDNLVAAINDLNEVMPASEDGPDWR